MLAFESVSKPFWTGTQHKVILDGVSLTVEPGNSLGTLASNGTGKEPTGPPLNRMPFAVKI